MSIVCHLDENIILPKLSDDQVKPPDVPKSCNHQSLLPCTKNIVVQFHRPVSLTSHVIKIFERVM